MNVRTPTPPLGASGRKRSTLHIALALAAAAAVAGTAPAALAQASAYPYKPVKLLVPYPPGCATDVIGRALAQKLGAALGQQFVLDNRAGAGGSLGAGVVANATPHGYTLLMGALTSHSINPALSPATVPCDINKRFAPVSIVGTVPLVFVVHPAVKANTLGELIALAKAQPGALAFVSAGNGSPQHLATEMFMRMAGVDVLRVPYKCSGPAMTDLVGGQVQAMIETAPAAGGQVKAGKLRGLATTTSTSVASLPGVPTTAQAGLPGFEVSSMFGIAAPTGTPEAIVNKLNATLETILADPEVRESLPAQGAVATHTTPAEATRAIHAEYAKWDKAFKDGNVKAA